MPTNIYQPQPNEFYTYIYLNPLKNNQPFYIGKAKGKKNDQRAFQHLYASEKTNPHKRHTIRKIQEAGLQPSIKCAWHGPEEAKAFWFERFFIALYGTRYDGTGILTNMTKGGEGASGKPSWNKGKTGGIPWNKGKKASLQARQNQSDAHKGKTNPHKGVPCSAETRRKMSEAHKGQIPWNKGKRYRHRIK